MKKIEKQVGWVILTQHVLNVKRRYSWLATQPTYSGALIATVSVDPILGITGITTPLNPYVLN